jgi:hypothetical protein
MSTASKKRLLGAPQSKPTSTDLSTDSDNSDSDDGAGVAPVIKRPKTGPSTSNLTSNPKSLSARSMYLLQGKSATGVSMAPAHLGRTADSETARYLLSKMDQMRPEMNASAKQDALAYEGSIELPQWRDADGTRTATSYKSIEDLLDTEERFIPYSLFAQMQHHDSQLATLGGVPSAGRHVTPFVRLSNKDQVTFEHAYKNMDAILKPVIRETEDYALRPEQRLAIGLYLQRYSSEIHASVRRTKDPCKAAATVGLPPMMRPNVSLVNLATGNGKTVIGITMAMTEVCDPDLWKNMQETWRESMWSNSTVEGLGLTRCPRLTTQRLARVVIAFVPSALMAQWRHTAEMVNKAMCFEKGFGFELWEGLGVLKRAGVGENGQEGVRRTMREADRQSRATDRAILWLVPAKTDSAYQTLRSDPHIWFPCRIFDEGTSTTDPKSWALESKPISNLILQATVERLTKTTQSQVRHPLRVALNNQSYDSNNTEHAAIFHMLSLPDWLRYLVGKGMADVMPCGLKRIGLKIRVQSMSGRLLKSDLTITGIDSLLKTVLSNVGLDQMLSNEEQDNLMNKCQHILGTRILEQPTGVQNPIEEGASSGTIYDRLKAAEAYASSQIAELPQKPPPQNPPVRLTREQEQYWHEIEAKRRAYNATTRMFTTLAAAVSPDEPLECPISLEEIPPEHVAILPCCTNPFDNRERHRLGNNCPMCNQPLNGIMNVKQMVEAIDNVPKPKPSSKEEEAVDNTPMVDDEPKLVETLDRMSSADKTYSGSMKAVVDTIRTFLRYKPKGARILLAFACDGNENQATRQTRTTLNTSLPNLLTSVDAITAKATETIKKFTTEDDSNRILLINTNDRSLSLEGLDLWTADLIILDKMSSSMLKPATVVQAIGRIMRPQFRIYIPTGRGITGAASSSDADGRVGHPAKWLVLLERKDTDDVNSDDEDEARDNHDDDDVEEVDADEFDRLVHNDGVNEVEEDGDGWEDFDPAALMDVDAEEARRIMGNA